MKMRIVIAGPTASGKSRLAADLAVKLDGEIISVDSRQCFKKIDLGTAKPSADDLKEVKHYNISCLPLDEDDSVAKFRKRALKWANEIEENGKTVIFCGGSTLHLQSLLQPLDDIPSSNPDHIAELNNQAEELGLESLYKELQRVDPDYCEAMDGMNRQRIIRALDVWRQTGKPFSSFHQNKPVTKPEYYTVFALNHPRKMLHQRIEKRTNQMFEAGLIQEVEALIDAGYSPDLQALQTVGYRQVIQFINGKISREQMIKDSKTATRRYAKRQITWLRRWPFVQWLDGTKPAEELITEIKQRVAAES